MDNLSTNAAIPPDLLHRNEQWMDIAHTFTHTLQPETPVPPTFDDLDFATARVDGIPDHHNTGFSSPTQLRRKPNLNASTGPPQNIHARSASGISKLPSVPAFHHKADLNDQPSISQSSITGAHSSLSRNPSNSTTNRSSSQRRPPASHSSYGVETTCGPPPSYSTQRTLSQDRVWKVDSGSRFSAKNESEDHDLLMSGPVSQKEAFETAPEPFTTDDTSSPETIDSQSIATPKEEQLEGATAMSMTTYGVHVREESPDRDRDRTIRAPAPASGEEESKGSSSDERKSEDLFLNIARTDGASRGPVSRAERRRSRISLPFLSSTRSSQQLHSPTRDIDPAVLSPRTEIASHYSKRSSLGQHTITAASAHPLDDSQRPRTQGNGRALSIATRSVIGRDTGDGLSESFRGHGRRFSNATTDSGLRVQTRLSMPARGSRLASDSNAIERPKYADHNTTESTISTTAPSTVWDELEDLKSRIRKLELTGKLPPSSAAAMSSAERPRTATTAATTMSSSPKNNKASVMQSTIEGIPSTVHPLLHEALSQARPVLNNEVYQKLQATASDALQLVVMMNGDAYPATNSSYGIASATERQIKRTAESLCRGLTELTIALSAEPKSAASPNFRPASRDASSMLNQGFVSRRLSNEASDLPPVATRVQSRLDSRRTSLQYANHRAGYSTPDTAVHTPNGQSARKMSNSSGAPPSTAWMRHRRTQGYLDGATGDENNDSPVVRPVSRAMTEVGAGYRHSPRDRAHASREYTSQHPMPMQFESLPEPRSTMPAGMGSNFSIRRKYTSPASAVGTPDNTLMTPRERESFGRISLATSREGNSMETPPENITIARGNASGSRRSLGLASRIGSSVGSRLRAVRAERNAAPQKLQGNPFAQQEQESMRQPAVEGRSIVSAGGME